jgi:hypothetical protein
MLFYQYGSTLYEQSLAWRVVVEVRMPGHPVRLTLQTDEELLWRIMDSAAVTRHNHEITREATRAALKTSCILHSQCS